MRTIARLVDDSVLLLSTVSFGSAAENAKALLDQAGVSKGLCLHIGCDWAGE